jgi:hypothetical protein
MNHQRSLLTSLLAALVLLIHTGPLQARPHSQVVTHLSFNQPGFYTSGELRGTFRATPDVNGGWRVKADFQPHGLQIILPAGDFGAFGCPARGSASATALTLAGVSVRVIANGIYCIHPVTHQRIDRAVTCTLTVAADGVVSVQSISM